jgi:hypothetical protein
MKNIILVINSFLFATSLAAAGPGDSDIIWGKLTVNKEQQVVISDLRNITNRNGYDNQPSFTLDGKSILYTAMFEGEKLQTDIMQIEINLCPNCKSTARNLTNSLVSEYSPTPMDLDSFTSVVVEPDNKQRIWQYSLSAINQPSLVEQEMEPVGYFAWGKNRELAMFILGEPHTLQFKANQTSKPVIVDSDIGRSVKTIPHKNWFSYIKAASEKQKNNQARAFSFTEPNKTVKLIELPDNAEYFNWHPSGHLFSARGNILVAADFSHWPTDLTKVNWVDIASTQKVCNGGSITRIAFSLKGEQIAFVCQWP